MIYQDMFMESGADKDWDETNVDNPVSVLTSSTINGTTNNEAILVEENATLCQNKFWLPECLFVDRSKLHFFFSTGVW